MNAGHRVTTMCAAFTLVSALAHAQSDTTQNTGSPETGTERRVQEVVVTGSRIGRSTFTTPNPVSVLNSDEMSRLGLANVGDAVAQLPQNSAFVTAANVLSVRLITSWLYDFEVGDVNWAGQAGPTAAFGDFNTSPRWQGSLTTGYARGNFAATVQLRHIGSGRYNVTYIGPDSSSYSPSLPNSINDNTVASATYVNVAGSYRLHTGTDGSLVEVFGAINNLFDRDPPIAPGGNGYPTNPVYFDTYGASWKAGVRVQF